VIKQAERKLYEWQYDMLGSFYGKLFDIISKADSKNLAKLRLAYPEEVEAVVRYKTESGYWEDVKLRMKHFQETDFNVPEIVELEVRK